MYSNILALALLLLVTTAHSLWFWSAPEQEAESDSDDDSDSDSNVDVTTGIQPSTAVITTPEPLISFAYLEGSCLAIQHTYRAKTAAESQCSLFGSDLVELDDPIKHQVFTEWLFNELAIDSNDLVLTSGVRVNSQWQWGSSGPAVEEEDSRWRTANDDPAEGCLALGADGWHSTNCENLNMFLCETKCLWNEWSPCYGGICDKYPGVKNRTAVQCSCKNIETTNCTHFASCQGEKYVRMEEGCYPTSSLVSRSLSECINMCTGMPGCSQVSYAAEQHICHITESDTIQDVIKQTDCWRKRRFE